uniref:DUF4440 domain-containing protein n=1 Tax=Panagrolaimus sp. PS1159 TaxID=55785 RepID=A0AC35G8V6_9BILA
MGLSKEEVNALIKKHTKEFDAAWETKDAKKLADFYHPNCAIVHVGKQSYYGKETIIKLMEEFLKYPKKFSLADDAENFEAGNGEYLITRGHWISESEDGSKKAFGYEQILKKHSDGRYLVYHDEFEYE